MSSVSGATSSLGNTSLRGYGGMASGIDRDAMIEQMTKGTNTKITKQKDAMTKLSWKQEAYQSVSGKILDLYDNYFSYSSNSNLMDPSIFAKNQISVLGNSDVTKFVSATGTSKLINSLSILGVKQTATASTRMSDYKGSDNFISADRLTNTRLNDPDACKTSNLVGRQLTFGLYNDADSRFDQTVTFKFPATYKDDAGKTQEIDYTDIYGSDGKTVDKTKTDQLMDKLNKSLKQAGLKLGDDNLSDVIEFKFDGANFQLQTKAGHEDTSIVLSDSSSALSVLGYKTPVDADGKPTIDTSKGISLKAANHVFNANSHDFADKSITKQSMVQYMTGKKLTFSYGGQTKEVELVKEGESFTDDPDLTVSGSKTALAKLADAMNGRFDKAFGAGNVKAVDDGGALKFEVKDTKETLTVKSNDPEVRSMLGILNGASNKLSMSSSIWENREKLGIKKPDGINSYSDWEKEAFEADLKETKNPPDPEYPDGRTYIEINGTKIDVTADTTLNDLIDKINSNKEVGVKASYLASSNQFVLVNDESGKRGEISLGGSGKSGGLGGTLFGTKKGGAGSSNDGQNAQILVSYGSGINTMVESLSNSFDLEGLRVTVTNEFGNVGGTDGKWTSDKSQAVTFSAKADVDGVTKNVKKFVDDYNALVKEINTQVTTKPDKSYGPLTDEQKKDMSDTSVENWEKKAKEGLLFNDAAMRALSMSIQGVMTEVLGSGVGYDELEKMGFSISDDYSDGGIITFDENKFKDAMTNDPDKVSQLFTGGGDVKKGFSKIVEDSLSPYANRYPTKNGNSYGRLIEEAGSPKLPLTITDNQIYKQLKDMEKNIDKLKDQLKSEQDRYISQFTAMETSINKMNAQASYLSKLQA